MDSYPFDTTGLTDEEIESYYKSYAILKSNFNLESTGEIDFHLELFEVFKNYSEITVRDSFVIKQDNNNDCYILFVETELRNHDHGKVSGNRAHQVWALAFLKADFGRMLIRRETLADKIIELVHPVELDFAEDKAFSDTFYVLVNDREKALKGVDRRFRNAVMDIRHDHFIIEIVEHTLIVGSNEPVSAEKTLHLAEFITRICAHC